MPESSKKKPQGQRQKGAQPAKSKQKSASKQSGGSKAQLVESSATDEASLGNHTDPIREFLGNVERVRREKDCRAAFRLIAEHILQ